MVVAPSVPVSTGCHSVSFPVVVFPVTSTKTSHEYRPVLLFLNVDSLSHNTPFRISVSSRPLPLFLFRPANPGTRVSDIHRTCLGSNSLSDVSPFTSHSLVP